MQHAPQPHTERIPQRRFLVAQLGARMHYAVPRILEAAGMLEVFYTDIAATRGFPAVALRLLPSRIRNGGMIGRIGARAPLGVPAAKTRAFTAFGMQYLLRQRRAAASRDLSAAYLWAGAEFCRRVLNAGVSGANALYTFNSAALELLRFGRRNGMTGILEQTIAPKLIEMRLTAEEASRWPDWARAAPAGAHERAYADREREEWELADLILCGSEFVREGIAQLGGPVERCVVVPYGVDLPAHPPRRDSGVPFRVLYAGSVGLRKGAPYLLDAARRLAQRVEFRLAGRLETPDEVLHCLPANVSVIGPVPRSEMESQFGWAHVLVLPSLCEGSATACYEALSHALPVITTRNAGSVVRDSVEGFLVPIRDPEAIADRIRMLADDPGLYSQMSANAWLRAREFSLEAYAGRLLRALSAETCPAPL